LTNNLPVHQLRIHAATELITIPQYVDSSRTYEFEGAITGFYSDPAPQALRNDKAFRASQTRTKNQYFYAEKSPKFERTLGSSSMRVQSRLFIDGYYTFPIEETQEPGYLDLINVSFNSTNRPISEGGLIIGGAGGGSSCRRNVPLKTTPGKQVRKVTVLSTPSNTRPPSDSLGSASSSSFDGSSSRSTGASSIYNDGQSDLTLYLDDPDGEGNAGISPTRPPKKRPLQDTLIIESSSKRQRRPTQKARDTEADIDDG
jgi:hypothetical protein